MASLLLLAYVLVLWCSYNAYCLLVNYRQASRLNIPTVCVPVSPDNPLWIALQTTFSSLFRYVPFDTFSFTRYCRLGWEFHDRYKTHQRLGDAWMLVTPNRKWLYVAQAEAAYEILSRGREFRRPVWMLDMLNVFGPNVATAEGSDWQRQRKLTATPFNEQTSRLVWAESLRQAGDMVDSWLQNDQEGLRSTSEDTKTLALHVLAHAGFQKSYPFKSMAKAGAATKPSTYRDSLSIILRNIFVVLILPPVAFRLPFLSTKWSRIGWAITEFRQYMLDQLADEKRLIAEGKPGSGTLMSNLVRASEVRPELAREGANGSAVVDGKGYEMKPLSVDEILGNVFLFNFAGHDSTASSLAYSILLLVADLEIQDWIAEELNFYLDSDDSETWKYDVVFPKLKRCLAVLLETLRLYNPLIGVPKYTGHQSPTLRVGNQEINVPKDTLVIPNLMGLHAHPRYWGTDPLAWRPSRWIVGSTNSLHRDLSTRLSQESLFVPEKGTYIAFSEGIRHCPGRKFVQVEFVATMAALFRNFRARPVAKDGETPDAAAKRVLEMVEDSNLELLLQMRDPDSVSVSWSRR